MREIGFRGKSELKSLAHKRDLTAYGKKRRPKGRQNYYYYNSNNVLEALRLGSARLSSTSRLDGRLSVALAD